MILGQENLRGTIMGVLLDSIKGQGVRHFRLSDEEETSPKKASCRIAQGTVDHFAPKSPSMGAQGLSGHQISLDSAGAHHRGRVWWSKALLNSLPPLSTVNEGSGEGGIEKECLYDMLRIVAKENDYLKLNLYDGL